MSDRITLAQMASEARRHHVSLRDWIRNMDRLVSLGKKAPFDLGGEKANLPVAEELANLMTRIETGELRLVRGEGA
jgi:hypothetical protein